ncbi:hypothetical protein B9Z55_009162 [Caenorhabditis nigoni]|uniref:Uncharacterized protein n=1 Tax=Caenorhabditis nigoni TaxID=1611254 RepID=A0A2G5UQR1_9PELO|nr:hypothetical protein B9Z55_009162 [Caenorhabditis nigoni]
MGGLCGKDEWVCQPVKVITYSHHQTLYVFCVFWVIFQMLCCSSSISIDCRLPLHYPCNIFRTNGTIEISVFGPKRDF